MVMGELYTGTDILVIGAGPGGYVAAIRAAQLGKEVMLVDKDGLGGVCLNIGCIPSKALISAAELVSRVKEASVMGITAVGLKVDVPRLQSWKADVVKGLADGIAALCKNHGIEVVKGEAVLESSTKAKINGHPDIEGVEFKHCIIATGSTPADVPGVPFDGTSVVSSTEALSFSEVPKELLVIGGGYIGLELGMVYAKLGSRVTVVEFTNQLLYGLDPEIVVFVERRAHQLGMQLYFESKAEGVTIAEGKAMVTVTSKEKGKLTLTADKVLVAVGRKPSTQSLGLQKTKVQLDQKGFITVDAQMRTTDPYIFAIGDVAGHPMLAHKASRQGKIAAEVICGKRSAYDNLVVPAVVFTDPEIATVGMSEAEAMAKGYEVKVGRFSFAASGRALTMNEPDGMTKLVSDKVSGRLLGAQIAGHHASDMISELSLAIEMGALTSDIEATIHPHPTFPETIEEAAEDVEDQAIHLFRAKK